MRDYGHDEILEVNQNLNQLLEKLKLGDVTVEYQQIRERPPLNEATLKWNIPNHQTFEVKRTSNLRKLARRAAASALLRALNQAGITKHTIPESALDLVQSRWGRITQALYSNAPVPRQQTRYTPRPAGGHTGYYSEPRAPRSGTLIAAPPTRTGFGSDDVPAAVPAYDPRAVYGQYVGQILGTSSWDYFPPQHEQAYKHHYNDRGYKARHWKRRNDEFRRKNPADESLHSSFKPNYSAPARLELDADYEPTSNTETPEPSSYNPSLSGNLPAVIRKQPLPAPPHQFRRKKHWGRLQLASTQTFDTELEHHDQPSCVQDLESDTGGRNVEDFEQPAVVASRSAKVPNDKNHVETNQDIEAGNDAKLVHERNDDMEETKETEDASELKYRRNKDIDVEAIGDEEKVDEQTTNSDEIQNVMLAAVGISMDMDTITSPKGKEDECLSNAEGNEKNGAAPHRDVDERVYEASGEKQDFENMPQSESNEADGDDGDEAEHGQDEEVERTHVVEKNSIQAKARETTKHAPEISHPGKKDATTARKRLLKREKRAQDNGLKSKQGASHRPIKRSMKLLDRPETKDKQDGTGAENQVQSVQNDEVIPKKRDFADVEVSNSNIKPFCNPKGYSFVRFEGISIRSQILHQPPPVIPAKKRFKVLSNPFTVHLYGSLVEESVYELILFTKFNTPRHVHLSVHLYGTQDVGMKTPRMKTGHPPNLTAEYHENMNCTERQLRTKMAQDASAKMGHLRQSYDSTTRVVVVTSHDDLASRNGVQIVETKDLTDYMKNLTAKSTSYPAVKSS